MCFYVYFCQAPTVDSIGVYHAKKPFFLGGSTVGTILAYGWRDSERWFVKAKSSSDQRDNDIRHLPQAAFFSGFSYESHLFLLQELGLKQIFSRVSRRLKGNSNSGCRKRINQTTHSANGQLFVMFGRLHLVQCDEKTRLSYFDTDFGWFNKIHQKPKHHCQGCGSRVQTFSQARFSFQQCFFRWNIVDCMDLHIFIYIYIHTWNPNDPCFDWNFDLVLEGSTTKMEDT